MTRKSLKFSEILRPDIGLIDPGPFLKNKVVLPKKDAMTD